MSRRHRRFIAWIGLLGIVFAQMAVTAHACMLQPRTIDPAAAEGLPHQRHCSGVDQPAAPAPQGNACELQCSDVAPSAAAPDLPPMGLASSPITVAPVTPPTVTRMLGRSFLAADIAAPPLSLFCRLLN